MPNRDAYPTIWITLTMICISVNVAALLMYAASMLGRTPVLLPLALAILCAALGIVSIALSIRPRNGSSKTTRVYAISSIAWLASAVFNLYQFKSVLYVA